MKIYIDLKGTAYGVAGLALDERNLIARLKERADQCDDYAQFRNYWLAEVERFYSAQGLSRRETLETVGYRIGQDLGSRLGIAEGKMRRPDYRDELEVLVQKNFRTRKEFCDATGLSEDMLSHVLARRKHLGIDTLSDALARIGYTIHIAPLSNAM